MIEITLEYLASQGLSRTFLKRFFSKICFTASCWIWTAFRLKHGDKRGYGTIGKGSDRAGKILAHRASWIIHFGPIPEDNCVLHDCPGGDNRACVNPAHLWLGDHRYNAVDAVNKGIRMGGKTRLTQKTANDIKELYATGHCTHDGLARMFEVSDTAIGMVLRGKSWV